MEIWTNFNLKCSVFSAHKNVVFLDIQVTHSKQIKNQTKMIFFLDV